MIIFSISCKAVGVQLVYSSVKWKYPSSGPGLDCCFNGQARGDTRGGQSGSNSGFTPANDAACLLFLTEYAACV